MTEQTLFFNGRVWRRLLDGDEQAVRLLEELYRRSGGAEPPSSTLTEVVTEVSTVTETTSRTAQGLDVLRRQLQIQRDTIQQQNLGFDLLRRRLQSRDSENQLLLSEIKKLQNRVQQLENAA